MAKTRFFIPVFLMLVAFVSYCGIATALNLPLVKNITTHTFNYTPDGDDQYYVWLINWVKTSVVDHKHSLALANTVYYPAGTDLRLGADGYVNITISAIIDAIVHNPIFAYNLVMLGSLVASAVAAYLLAYVLWRHWFSAFVVGLIFGFSSFLITRSQVHLNLVAAECIPLVALCLIKLAQTGKWRWVFGVIISVAFAGLSSNYYLLASLLTAGGILIWIMFTQPKNVWLDRLGKTFCAAGIGVALYIMSIWPVFQAVQHAPNFVIPEAASFAYSLDAFSFFLPPFWLLLGGQAVAGLTAKIFLSNESIAFLGWLEIIILILSGISWHRMRHTPHDRSLIQLLAICIFLSIFIASGPYIRIMGGYTGIPLLFHAIHGWPLVSMLSSPARFVIIAMLGISLFIGYILRSWWANLSNNKNILYGVSLAIVLAFVGERWISPYSLRDYEPPASTVFLKAAPDYGAVLNIPLGIDIFPQDTLSQYQHGRPIVGGYMSRYTGTPERNAFIVSTPEIYRYLCGHDATQDTRPLRPISEFSQWLESKGVAYIVLHTKRECSGVNGDQFREYVQRSTPVFSDADTLIYRVTDLAKP